MTQPTGRPQRAVADRLQALVSRAVEGEEAALSGRLEGVRAELRRLSDVVEEAQPALSGSVSSLREDLATATATASDEVVARLDVLAGRVDALGAEVREAAAPAEAGPVQVDTSRLEVRLAALEEQLTRIGGVVVDLEESLEDRVGSQAHVLAGVPPVLARVEGVLAELPGRLDALGGDDGLPWLRAVLDRAAAERGSLATDVGSLAQEMGSLAKDLRSVTEGVAADDGDEEVARRLDALTVAVEGLAARPGPAEVDLDVLAEAVLERLRPVLEEETGRAVAQSVPALLEESERRTAAHVDDAVLALAEALLRRRAPGGLDVAPEPEAVADDLPTDLAGFDDTDGPEADDSPSADTGDHGDAEAPVDAPAQGAELVESPVADDEAGRGTAEVEQEPAMSGAPGAGDGKSGRRGWFTTRS